MQKYLIILSFNLVLKIFELGLELIFNLENAYSYFNLGN